LLPDPVVLFFLLGLFARLVRSDLRVPEALHIIAEGALEKSPVEDLSVSMFLSEVAVLRPEKFT